MNNAKLTVLIDSAPGALAVEEVLAEGRPDHIRVLHRCDAAASKDENLLVFSTASTLDHVAECVSVANKAHKLAALVVYRDVDSDWLPYVFHQSGLRTLRNMLVHSNPDLPRRILNAWAIGAQNDFVATAAVINDRLVVKSCSFEEFSISFNAFPSLRSIPIEEREQFELEEDGFLIHWPSADVHLDLDAIRFANDPKLQQEARTSRLGDQREIGLAIRRIREEAGLTQSEIDDVSERQIRRVESGERLTVPTLEAIAVALKVDADELLERIGNAIDDHRLSPKVEPPARSWIPQRDRAAPRSKHLVQEPNQTLKLAADSIEGPEHKVWHLATDFGRVDGILQHDLKRDRLIFKITEIVGNAVESARYLLLLSGHLLAHHIRSQAFIPTTGALVEIGVGLGVVPSDVDDIRARGIDEP